jgi:SAM-dependent MidA family methyltransferase
MKVVDPDSMKQLKKFHIIEFGPGLGTLQSNIIRVLD